MIDVDRELVLFVPAAGMPRVAGFRIRSWQPATRDETDQETVASSSTAAV